MMTPNELGSYVLDTVQIYFPWDDDLYTYLREAGLASKNKKMKVLPLVYSDNCESTQGIIKIKRNYVINPAIIGIDHVTLGWERTDKNFIIPAEKPQLKVLYEKINGNELLKFKVLPKVSGKNEYHTEFSVMSAFGKMYSNWATFYFTLNDFKELVNVLIGRFGHLYDEQEAKELKRESKQDQREEMYWTLVPIFDYQFSLAEFDYIEKYLRESGVKGDLPSLIYHSYNDKHVQMMKPIIKLGVIQTKNEHGFWVRKPQIVMKIAQDKVTMTKRGVKAKAKGVIDNTAPPENFSRVKLKDFLDSVARLRSYLRNSEFGIQL